mmetsp:Transcript_14540/g.51111  ORF Transcript_14540/g.51111 Transcript_14540/m.51111 type:complete len:848 (-) Transcript_14540:20-2563(-)
MAAALTLILPIGVRNPVVRPDSELSNAARQIEKALESGFSSEDRSALATKVASSKGGTQIRGRPPGAQGCDPIIKVIAACIGESGSRAAVGAHPERMAPGVGRLSTILSSLQLRTPQSSTIGSPASMRRTSAAPASSRVTITGPSPRGSVAPPGKASRKSSFTGLRSGNALLPLKPVGISPRSSALGRFAPVGGSRTPSERSDSDGFSEDGEPARAPSGASRKGGVWQPPKASAGGGDSAERVRVDNRMSTASSSSSDSQHNRDSIMSQTMGHLPKVLGGAAVGGGHTAGKRHHSKHVGFDADAGRTSVVNPTDDDRKFAKQVLSDALSKGGGAVKSEPIANLRALRDAVRNTEDRAVLAFDKLTTRRGESAQKKAEMRGRVVGKLREARHQAIMLRLHAHEMPGEQTNLRARRGSSPSPPGLKHADTPTSLDLCPIASRSPSPTTLVEKRRAQVNATSEDIEPDAGPAPPSPWLNVDGVSRVEIPRLRYRFRKQWKILSGNYGGEVQTTRRMHLECARRIGLAESGLDLQAAYGIKDENLQGYLEKKLWNILIDAATKIQRRWRCYATVKHSLEERRVRHCSATLMKNWWKYGLPIRRRINRRRRMGHSVLLIAIAWRRNLQTARTRSARELKAIHASLDAQNLAMISAHEPWIVLLQRLVRGFLARREARRRRRLKAERAPKLTWQSPASVLRQTDSSPGSQVRSNLLGGMLQLRVPIFGSEEDTGTPPDDEREGAVTPVMELFSTGQALSARGAHMELSAPAVALSARGARTFFTAPVTPSCGVLLRRKRGSGSYASSGAAAAAADRARRQTTQPVALESFNKPRRIALTQPLLSSSRRLGETI